MSMPRFLKTRVSSFEISSSSTGTTRGRNSRIVTSAPKLRKMDANSTPTAPAPITISDFGGWGRARISMLVRMRSSAVSPGNNFASDPIASITFFAFTLLLAPFVSTSTVCTPSFAGPVILPKPGITVTLFFFIRNSRPLTCLVMMPLLRFCTASQSSVGVPMLAMPSSAACFRWSQISALKSRALVGMQPTCRQVPPSLGLASRSATFSPYSAPRMAAVYPAGPPPITATS